MLLPCRNAATTLHEALDSLARQTFPDFEVIVVDDGSTDESPHIAAAFAREDPRFRLIRSDPIGIVEALRIAAAQARAPILARMDADDIAHPARFEKQLAYLENHPHVGLCGTFVEHFGTPAAPGLRRYLAWINSVHTPDAIALERFIECPIPHPTFMMRRNAFQTAGGYTERGWPEDYDLFLRVATTGCQLGKVPEPLLRWRHSAARLSMTHPRYSPAQFRAVKRHHLLESVLNTDRPFYQWGAGEVGKRWLREWGRRTPIATIDINPRKIGKHIHGVPVIPPDHLPPPGHATTLVAVGSPGAREEIRAWLSQRAYREGTDYFFIA